MLFLFYRDGNQFHYSPIFVRSMLVAMDSYRQLIERWENGILQYFCGWLKAKDWELNYLKFGDFPANDGPNLVPMFLASKRGRSMEPLRELQGVAGKDRFVVVGRKGKVTKIRGRDLCLG